MFILFTSIVFAIKDWRTAQSRLKHFIDFIIKMKILKGPYIFLGDSGKVLIGIFKYSIFLTGFKIDYALFN